MILMKQNFIQTKDKETAEKLHALGFQEIPSVLGYYTFLNCQKCNFEEVDTHKISFTNKLCI